MVLENRLFYPSRFDILMLRSKVLEAIKEFNEFRSPEATANSF